MSIGSSTKLVNILDLNRCTKRKLVTVPLNIYVLQITLSRPILRADSLMEALHQSAAVAISPEKGEGIVAFIS